jgi:uncharacterized lipoprotein YbaY
MRASRPWTFWLLTTALAGCATQSPQPSAPTSSTRGTTLVQMASVTAVSEPLVRDERTANPTVTELSVRFDDGKIRSFNIGPGEIFQPGDRVRVTSRNGNTRITHE